VRREWRGLGARTQTCVLSCGHSLSPSHVCPRSKQPPWRAATVPGTAPHGRRQVLRGCPPTSQRSGASASAQSNTEQPATRRSARGAARARGYNDGRAGRQAAVAALDVHELLHADVRAEARLARAGQPRQRWHPARATAAAAAWCLSPDAHQRRPQVPRAWLHPCMYSGRHVSFLSSRKHKFHGIKWRRAEPPLARPAGTLPHVDAQPDGRASVTTKPSAPTSLSATRSATTLELPVAMLAKGPACTSTGVSSRVCGAELG